MVPPSECPNIPIFDFGLTIRKYSIPAIISDKNVSVVALLLGLGYSLFELPNSFLKRRLGIEEGKTAKGFKKYFLKKIN